VVARVSGEQFIAAFSDLDDGRARLARDPGQHVQRDAHRIGQRLVLSDGDAGHEREKVVIPDEHFAMIGPKALRRRSRAVQLIGGVAPDPDRIRPHRPR
jgi:hypothetical protein